MRKIRGPAGFTGSLIGAEFDDLDAAQTWAKADSLYVRRRLRDRHRETVSQGVAVTDRIERIRERLTCELAPVQLEVEDESHRHKGHAGAQDGRGHFRVTVVSEKFRGAVPLARHRMIYAALGDMMTTDIHALAIDARAPQDVTEKSHV